VSWSRIARSSATRIGFATVITIDIGANLMRFVRAAKSANRRMGFTESSLPSVWKWCSVVENASMPSWSAVIARWRSSSSIIW